MMNKKNGGGADAMVCYSCHGCQCGGRGWTFFLLRTLLTVFILMIVFWFGVSVGALGSRGAGRYSMMPWGSNAGGAPMMRMYGATSTPSASGAPQNY